MHKTRAKCECEDWGHKDDPCPHTAVAVKFTDYGPSFICRPCSLMGHMDDGPTLDFIKLLDLANKIKRYIDTERTE
jgi:hypothetical protein